MGALPLASATWTSVLHVRVEPGGPTVSDLPAMSGTYSIVDGALRFVPDVPLDRRQRYKITFDPSQLPNRSTPPQETWRSRPMEMALSPRAHDTEARVQVTHVFPPDTLVENQLRMYLFFSGPMGLQPARDRVRLLDEQGHEVADAFLPLSVSLWNGDHTRYTLLFDPGRVKRGLLPNRQVGQPLVRGKRYTLIVDAAWRDAQGRSLVSAFSRTFTVLPPAYEPIAPADWNVAVPAKNTHDPLVVTFARALDHAIAEKALSIADQHGSRMKGTIVVNEQTTRWAFTPVAPWAPGDYLVVTEAELEDGAGNRVGRAFDFDALSRAPSKNETGDPHAQASLPFRIAP
jgi:hypothetical protein